MHRMLRHGIAVACFLVGAAAAPGALAADITPVRNTAPTAAQALAQRVLESGDHARAPFAIVDKQAALLMVYRANGALAGASPILVGATPGDHAVPGAGARAQTGRLRPSDRTTPAGRYASEPGRNRAGEAIVWLDYQAALAIHRLRPGDDARRRARHLASPEPGDNRMSAGCVVVPEAFYLSVVQPLLGRQRGAVYVMPEQQRWQSLWPDLDTGAM